MGFTWDQGRLSTDLEDDEWTIGIVKEEYTSRDPSRWPLAHSSALNINCRLPELYVG